MKKKYKSLLGKSIFIDKKNGDVDKILKKCLKFKYISFDVFDTLVKRNLGKPDDLFVILDKTAKNYNIEDFAKLRSLVEKKLRKNKSFITLDDIYNEIEKVIGKEKTIILKNHEINLELSYCQPNYEIVKLYEILKKSGKKIVATSDMYLSSQIISQILEKCGFYLDYIYVSCECKAKKRDGSLFKYVLKTEKIKCSNLIHIGDNYIADILGARKCNVSAVHISKKNIKYNNKKFKKFIKESNKYDVFYSIINNNLKLQDSYYKKIGFALFGPLVYNYTNWLAKKCEEHDLKKIFFFARDGYVLKKAFDMLYKNKYETSYIYFSRRAIRIPFSFLSPSYENMMKFFPKTKVLTPKVYFENFGLDATKYEKLLVKYNLTLNTNIYYNDLFKNAIFKDIFESIYEDILKEAKKEYIILKKYINQEKLYGNVAIVDVGWHNSMQYYLSEIAKKNNYNLNMYGFYVGKMHGEKKVDVSEGFIYDSNDSKYADSALSFIGLMESIFLAKEGSTKMYEKTSDNIVKPVQLDYEYNYTDIEYRAFSEIQEGIDSFISIAGELIDLDVFSLSGYDSYLPIKSFGTNPYLLDVKYFSKFRYFSEEIVYFSNAKSLLFYALHLKKLKIDFYKSRWKIGFMKEVFKLKLPYYTIYRKMRG